MPLPGGRLYPDVPSRDNWFEQRRLNKPEADQWVYGTVTDDFLVPGYSGTAFTAGELEIVPLPRLVRYGAFKEVRLRVTAAGVLSSTIVQLFTYDLPEKEFRGVFGSKATFDTTGTGVRTATLDEVLTLQPGRYFLGILVLTANVSFANNFSVGLYNRRLSSQTAMPAKVGLSASTQVTTPPVPIVTYIADYIKDFF